jgi:hypothetical protein
MAHKTVKAVRHNDGHVVLLEPVNLPAEPFMVTLELPDEARPTSPAPEFAAWDLGVKEPLTRDQIYEDLI